MSFSNNLKTDFYRLKYSKWIWIMPIVIFALMLILYALYFILYGAYTTGTLPEAPEGIDVNDLFVAENIGKIMMFEAPNQSDLYIAILVGASLFICQEFASGMTKIRVSRGNSRTHIFFSKFVVLNSVTIVYTIGAYVLATVLSLIFFKINDFSAIDFGYLIRSIVLSIWVNISLTSFYMMIAYLIRNIGGTIGANVGTAIIIGIISGVAALLSESNLVREIVECAPSTLIQKAGYFGEYDLTTILELIFVPLFFIIICNIVSVLTLKSRDIK